ncbi:MAG: bifunctional oligoribonuclease/PAP phosphatase NrnA [Deltaproteobacteria bacterium]|nr:bifunctional oligoribonuclease/PAP phosphatase NrnA [Deltaproteobacteria bacterium]
MDFDDPLPGAIKRVVGLLEGGDRFLLMTHEDPDVDGLGSMLALGKSLTDLGKEVVLLLQKPLKPPLLLLTGAERMMPVSKPDGASEIKRKFDAVLALDCAERERLGVCLGAWSGGGVTINIDHHATNTFFGQHNLVDANSSSTGELLYRLIRAGGFPLDFEIAENLFAAIQSDTGSFRFTNTTSRTMRIAADLVAYGVKPWEISRRILNGYGPVRLKLLAMALARVEFHNEGRIGMMVLSKEMFNESGAHGSDSEGFVDYPRYVEGVELAVMISEKDENTYKFSIRSNAFVNVAELASRFGGGGHVKAAGFTCNGSLGTLKKDFLFEAGRLLNETPR